MKGSFRLLAIVGIGTVGLSLVLAAFCDAQDSKLKVLLKQRDVEKAELTDVQKRKIDQIKKQPVTRSFTIVELKADMSESLPKDVSLILELTPDVNLEIEDYDVTQNKGASTLKWKGRGDRSGQSVTFTVRDKIGTGLIYTGEDVYSIEPLGKGLHAVVRLDQSKFKPDEEPGIIEAKSKP